MRTGLLQFSAPTRCRWRRAAAAHAGRAAMRATRAAASAAHVVRAALATAALLLLAACGGGGGNAGGAEPFGIRVASPIRAKADSSGHLRVRIERRSDFAGAIRLGLDNPPEGVSTNEVTNAAANAEGAEAWLPLSFGAGLAPGTSLALTVRAEGLGHRASAAVEVTVDAPLPRSQELIADALAAGRIDRGKALLYRAYAQVGDSRLPAEFAGSGSVEEDLPFSLDVARERATLSLEALAALEPFLVRPNHPRSVFGVGSAAGARAVAAKDARRAQVAADGCSGKPEWITLRSARHPVRAWALCLEADTSRPRRHLERVIEVVDRVYGKMTALMGPAVPDLVDDDAIDIYVVPPWLESPRDGGYMSATEHATTRADLPQDGATSSAYILVNSLRLEQQGFALSLIHELFHVLQFANNAWIARFWLYDATATWASVHFNRTAGEAPGDSALLHGVRFRDYQKSASGLLRFNRSDEYNAYIWPFFMEHKTSNGGQGGEAVIGRTWRQLASVNTPADANNVLDGLFSFREHFRDFAYRNLNREYLPGDALPKAKRHANLDGAFPDALHQPQNRPPKLRIGTSTDEPMRLAATLEPLSAGYFDAEVQDAAVRQVIFDLGGASAQGIDLDALVKIDGAWESGPRDLAGRGELRFCRDRPAEKLDEITFIVSNHRHQPDARQTVSLRARGSPVPCTAWEGTITTRVERSEAASRYQATTHASVAFEVDDTAPAPGVWRLRAGTYTHEALYDHFGRTPPCRTSERASGAMAPGPLDPLRFGSTSAGLSVFQLATTVQYLGEGFTAVGIEQTSNCSGQDVTVTLPMTIKWWDSGGLREASPDGRTLGGSFAAPDGLGGTITFDWTLTRRD